MVHYLKCFLHVMEDKIQAQAREIKRYKDDYLELSQKFNQINNQIKERDAVHIERLRTAESHIENIEAENAMYRSQISAFKSERKAQLRKDKDMRRELDAAVQVMEDREIQIESHLSENNSKMKRMEMELQMLQEQLDICQDKNDMLREEKGKLTRIIEEEMVPLSEYQNNVKKFEKFQEVVSSETVSVDDYDILQKKFDNMKRVMDSNFVSVDEYEDLSQKYFRLEARSHEMVSLDEFKAVETKALNAWKQLEKMVPRDTYAKLQKEANFALERQMLLEASAQVLRDDKEEAVRQRTEMRSEADALKTKVNLLENDLSTATTELQKVRDLLVEKENTIIQLEQDIKTKEVDFISCQDKIASLNVALGNNKQLLHREMASKAEMQKKFEESEKAVEQLEQEKREYVVNHQDALTTLRKVHQKQLLQYETKCAELMSAADILKYQMDQKSNGMMQIEGGASSMARDHDVYTQNKTQYNQYQNSTSSPYKELLSQYMKRQRNPTPGTKRISDDCDIKSPGGVMQLGDLKSESPLSRPRPSLSSPSFDAKRTFASSGGGKEHEESTTLESLCASFKSHMSESSKLFSDEIRQIGI